MTTGRPNLRAFVERSAANASLGALGEVLLAAGRIVSEVERQLPGEISPELRAVHDSIVESLSHCSAAIAVMNAHMDIEEGGGDGANE